MAKIKNQNQLKPHNLKLSQLWSSRHSHPGPASHNPNPTPPNPRTHPRTAPGGGRAPRIEVALDDKIPSLLSAGWFSCSLFFSGVVRVVTLIPCLTLGSVWVTGRLYGHCWSEPDIAGWIFLPPFPDEPPPLLRKGRQHIEVIEFSCAASSVGTLPPLRMGMPRFSW
jgi:hypothetical protein